MPPGRQPLERPPHLLEREQLVVDGRLQVVLLDGAHHVLEHMARPLETLRAFSRALKPGGYCWIAVPRLDMLPVYRDIGYCLQARTHIVAFTEACLTDLLARANSLASRVKRPASSGTVHQASRAFVAGDHRF